MDIDDIEGFLVLPWGARWICGRAEINGDEIVLGSGSLESFDLYERDREAHSAGRYELAFELAAVETRHDACAVARRYGLLLRGPGSDVFREPCSLWATVAGQARLVLGLALALEHEDMDTLRHLATPWRHRLTPDTPQDILGEASVLLEGVLNDGLRHAREAVISAVRVTQDEWRGPSGRLFFAPQFENLVGYAFHRLAQIVSYRSPDLYECAFCRRIVARENGHRRTYCSDRCAGAAKKRRHRAREVG